MCFWHLQYVPRRRSLCYFSHFGDVFVFCVFRFAGELMTASHRSLQHDYEVSCSELDLLVNIALSVSTMYQLLNAADYAAQGLYFVC